jgi:prefoldin subunit 5
VDSAAGTTQADAQAPGPEAVLTIGDKTYPIAELPDDAQKLVMAVRDCEEQIKTLKRRLNYLEIARRSLIQELTSRLPD